MADDTKSWLAPEAAAALIEAIRARDTASVAGIVNSFGRDAEKFLNTPIAIDGGERQFFLTEAVNGHDGQIVSLLLEAGARPELRAQGESGKNAFYAPYANAFCIDLLLGNMRQRMPGAAGDRAIHDAIVGGKDQKTESCLFLFADKGNSDVLLKLLASLPNDSSRRQALQQCASPLGYDFDAKAQAKGTYYHPGKSVSLFTVIDLLERDNGGYRNVVYSRVSDIYRRAAYDHDADFFYNPLPEAGVVTSFQRKALEGKMQLAKRELSAQRMRDWLDAEETPVMPPPLAQRFLAVLPGLAGDAGLSASFGASSGADIAPLRQILESFGDDTRAIINTPILKADGTRTMPLAEIVNTGNAAALDLVLAYGADPARRAEGGSGKNAFYAENAQPSQVRKLVQNLRARYDDAKAADKAVHDAILGEKGQVTPAALVFLLDAGNGAAVEALFNALPNGASRAHALENAFSPLGLKVDRQARQAGIYLSIDRCFDLSDLAGFRYERLGLTSSADYATRNFLSQAAYELYSADKTQADFYYPGPKAYNYMVERATRDAEEKRYADLRAKELQQQQGYRETLKAALAEREEAEKDLKREQAAFLEQERRLRNVAAEVAQLEEQVKRNDETLAQLGNERGQLKKRLQAFTNGI